MILNENKLRQEINKSVKKEFKKYRGEIDVLWKYLNKLNERIKIIERGLK